MTTRRRPMARQSAGNETTERRSSAANTSKQSLVSAKTNTANSGQSENMPEQPMAGDPFDDANISDDEEGGTRIGDIYIPPPIPPHCSTESKGPRLIIRKIENNNFKSYAGKVILGPFHHCFTAIIGPNGSGKSNVIDSMLFVFGYRANKIRCKKISTLLHNSARYPNINMCSVAVHFRQIEDKDDGTCEEVPNSDIIVERTAFRDNSSYYTINGKRVQFKEVAKLLKKHHVDLDHNRFLILQGEVESIAMMKPKGQTEAECGMLEYLEDIVGTTRYKEPLVKINERVEQLTEERTEKHNRCKLAEREMNDLEQPYNEAVEYLRQENENTRTKNLRIQKYLSEKNKKLQEYTKQHDEIMAELKEHETEVDSLKKEREEKESQVQKEMQNHENMRKKKEDIEKKLEKSNSKFAEVQETMTILNKRRHHNKTQTTQSENQLEELRKVPEKNAKEIEECEKKLERLVKQKAELEEELQNNYTVLKEQTKPLIEEREKLETELMELKNNVDEAKAELALSESELKILKHDETAEVRKYESMKGSYEESEQSLQEKKAKVEELKERMPQMKQEVLEKTQQLKKLQQEEEQLRTQIMTIKAEINEKTVSMQAMRSNNKVLDFLMRQKAEGKIPGILGRLGDLGGIDSKYDVAISTACGRLDNIVVDTVNTAQECIEHLKRYDVGRASFIALEKVEHLRNQCGPIHTPENSSRLFDLVRVEDNRVTPAFYFALRNTLVANDLEQGTRIAYGAKRFRVVTLNGDVIETSGTMSGGGRTQIRGKMGTKVRTNTSKSAETSMISQKALEDMQIKAQELQSQINFNQEEQGRLEREIYQLNTTQQRNEAEIQKLLISIKSLEEQLPRIFKQLEAQKKRMQDTTTDQGKVKSIEESIVKKKETLKEAEEAAVQVNEQIAAIKSKIDAVHGDKIKAVQTKINSLENQIKKLKANISKLKVESTNNERNVAKLEQQIERLKADVLKAQDELKLLSEKRQQFDDDITALTKELEEAKEAIDKAKSEFSGVHKEITAIQKKESDLKLKRIEIDQKLQTVASKLSDVKAQIPHWREQLKPLRLHEIPGDSEPQTPLKTYTEEELATHTLQDIQYKESVQEELLKKKPNLSCISEYIEKRDVYLERVKVLEDITCKRNEMRQLYDDVRKKRYNEFMQGFHIITRKLKEMYQMITQGGDAELELVDSMDPFTEGVSFSVRPPKKTWKNISNLSGGEKTLSSLALVFALHYYKPSPLYFMDEIDAALDFKNISIVAHYIKERTKNAQFIIISLRSNMFELSDYLVGIYKVKDCTDSVCIQNEPPKMPLMETQQLQNQTQTQALHSQPAHMLVGTAADLSNLTAVQPSQALADKSVSLNDSIDASPPPSASAQKAIPSSQQENNENSESAANVLSQSAPRPSNNSTFAPQGESTGVTSSQLSCDGRSSANMTFIPQGESTALSQTLQMDVTQNATFTDSQFKKPLPPVTSN
ncbi:structural maintenance of chromosomes protein 4 [Lucilia sericata]|uniref:structural maintenance of chromosomes protein 4 n=1 Tax=Lucilia sericata TaxID=13632 RepID=UPI0018A87001|nr:structural maintenance of chromosomes protein 4 [Lucilia sericata]